MLEEWSISNFKSFVDDSVLGLKPLTIVCGANSSGKSTLIQSMLLVKQTVEHAPSTRAIALNGPLVRLGGFQDILNSAVREQDDKAAIGLGWRLRQPQPSKQNRDEVRFIDEELKTVSLRFLFDATHTSGDEATANLQPSLRTVDVQAEYMDSDGGEHQLSLSLKRASGQGRKLVFNTTSFGDPTAYLTFRVQSIDPDTKSRALFSKPAARIAGCLTHHFFPSTLVVRYDRAKALAREFTAQLTGQSPSPRRMINSNVTLHQATKDILLRALEGDQLLALRGVNVANYFESPSTTGDTTLFELGRRISTLPPSTRLHIRRIFAKHNGEIEKSIYETLDRELTLAASNVETLRSANNLTNSFFRFSLRYIGPLRDEPRPLYPLQALTSPTDVGPKGELTAAVLHLNQAREITYVPPTYFRNEGSPLRSKTGSLKSAAIEWLVYLGVARDVETSEQGKFGHALRIKIDAGGQFQDLTNVGVGVSQVLPIVVTCLLSPPGSTIIVEQPELHLHPAVQAKLADFFISLMLTGKQCIIETHGEHLVERLRFRVAQDRSDKVLNSTKIYFFERKEGATKFRDIKLNRYGAIEDWPDDFFDQSQKESEHIVLQALSRRKAEKSQNSDSN